MSERYDVVIIGGGPVGASLARALAHTPLRLALVEAVPPQKPGQPSYDERVLALSHGSRRIFTALGLWPALARHAQAIEHIHVSQRGRFGATRLHATDAGVDALGHVIPTRALGHVLWQSLADQDNLTLLCPARLQRLTLDERRVRLTLEDGRDLETALVVAADGGRSPTREQAGIAVERRDYRQVAVIATVTAEHPHPTTAYERFTASGPLALLPMTQGRYSLVYTVRAGEEDELLALDDTAFLKRLRDRFGPRLGQFTHTSNRVAYPLQLIHTRHITTTRLALAGNAAHTLHPVAGQGFNLGLRDVALLAELLSKAARNSEDPGAPRLLERYQTQRQDDHRRTIGLTDLLARSFLPQTAPAPLLRSLGLVSLNLCTPLKRRLSQRTMGLAPPVPRLARGLAP